MAKKKDLPYLSSLHSTLTVTLGEFRSSKEPREGAWVSVRLFIPSSLHLSPLSTHAIDGMFTTPSEIDVNSSGRIWRTIMAFHFRRSSILLILRGSTTHKPSPFTTPTPPLLSLFVSNSLSLTYPRTYTHSLPLAVSVSHCCRYDSEKQQKLLLCCSPSLPLCAHLPFFCLAFNSSTVIVPDWIFILEAKIKLIMCIHLSLLA